MSDVTKVIEALQKVSSGELQKVYNFINELKPYSPKPGSADAVMRSFGSWKMTHEEYEQFMRDIADCRPLDLDNGA